MKNKITSFWGKLNSLLFLLFITFPQYYLNTYATVTSTNNDFMDKFHNLMDEYSTEITTVLSVGMLLSVVIFIYHCVQLNNHANNPNARKQDISNLLITGVCLAAQGSVTAILGIVYYMFG